MVKRPLVADFDPLEHVVIGVGPYILGAAALAAVALSLGFSAFRLRRRLLPAWEGAPARLVEAVTGIALLIWLSEILGTLSLFYAWALVGFSLLLAACAFWWLRAAAAEASDVPPAGGRGGGGSRTTPPAAPPSPPDRTRGGAPPSLTSRDALPSLIAIAVVAVVFAHWGLTTADALNRGIFNFDSLWYHMPFAVDMVQSHSVTGLHYTDTVFTNWLYPQNSELLHAVGVLLTQRDTLSLFLNLGFLGLAFLAAWCIGRPYGRGHLSVVAVAIVLEAHTLVVREPGAAKNDIVTAALLLAAVAILVNAWAAQRPTSPQQKSSAVPFPQYLGERNSGAEGGRLGLPVGWALAAAGLAVGLAAGTKFTVMAMAAALSLAVVVLAPAGRRWAAAGWWFLPALAGGGFWYLRNLIAIGNPLPQMESLGPISLPHPERLQTARPDFSVAHYATDTGVWREYFGPGLDHAFGVLWPLVIGAAILGALLALIWGRDRIVRWVGGVALFGMLAYLFTPLSAAGLEGEPVAFAINIRYAIPALLVGLALLPLAAGRRALASSAGGRGGGGSRTTPPAAPPSPPDRTRGRSAWSWALLGALLVTLVVTNRSDAVLRDPDRLFAIVFATLVILIPAVIAWSYVVLSGRTRQVGGAAGRTIPGGVAGASSAGGRGGGGSRTTPPAAPPSPPDRTRGATIPSLIAIAVVVLVFAILAIGYPLQRDYLQDRFRNASADAGIPGMDLDSAYRWARGVEDARIGLAGTTAGFLQYGFYGTDLSNEVRYLGAKGPHGAFNAIPDCRAFRAAVNAADLDYLVTAPFLNFIHTARPIPSPEAGWLRGDPAVAPILRSPVPFPYIRGERNRGTGGPVAGVTVTVWRVRGRLDPAACGPANAPLHRIPNAPAT